MSFLLFMSPFDPCGLANMIFKLEIWNIKYIKSNEEYLYLFVSYSVGSNPIKLDIERTSVLST